MHQLRETQTLRAGCSKAEPKKIRPAADPLPGVAGRPKFNQLEMVTIGLSHARPNSGISGDLLSENEANPVVI